MNGSRSLGYTEKSQGRVTSTWSEAVCFLVPRLAAATRVALGGSVAGGGRSSTARGRAGVGGPRPLAETYGDKNGYNARKRRKSDAGYIQGGGSVAWRGAEKSDAGYIQQDRRHR